MESNVWASTSCAAIFGKHNIVTDLSYLLPQLTVFVVLYELLWGFIAVSSFFTHWDDYGEATHPINLSTVWLYSSVLSKHLGKPTASGLNSPEAIRQLDFIFTGPFQLKESILSALSESKMEKLREQAMVTEVAYYPCTRLSPFMKANQLLVSLSLRASLFRLVSLEFACNHFCH